MIDLHVGKILKSINAPRYYQVNEIVYDKHVIATLIVAKEKHGYFNVGYRGSFLSNLFVECSEQELHEVKLSLSGNEL